ncbi:hypothetical protein C8R45DRAFT_1102955 [Mycena sanguinolenta]|nr:hypothetical protein C8R45DRAFT_1102955 [Mycena sanguinolenta]
MEQVRAELGPWMAVGAQATWYHISELNASYQRLRRAQAEANLATLEYKDKINFLAQHASNIPQLLPSSASTLNMSKKPLHHEPLRFLFLSSTNPFPGSSGEVIDVTSDNENEDVDSSKTPKPSVTLPPMCNATVEESQMKGDKLDADGDSEPETQANGEDQTLPSED